jgi:hypothetical protein
VESSSTSSSQKPGHSRASARHHLLERVAEPDAAFVQPGLPDQPREQVHQPLARNLHEAPVRRDAHDRLGDQQRHDLAVAQAPTGVGLTGGQEIVRRVEHHRQQQVEVGEHRGPLGSTARIGTADFDLPRYVSYSTTTVVESLI